MKIGIMGGTFDPIHLGHLIAAERAREEMGLDQVWFIPSNIPPHKTYAPMGSVHHRWEMVQRAIAHHPQFKADDLEIRKGGVSYSIDTVKTFREQYPEDEFYWIIGGDMVQHLPHWRQVDELISLITFIGLQRPGFPILLEEMPEAIARQVMVVPMPFIEISSTEVRRRRKNGRSIRYLVPEQVYSYIEENRLYES